MVCATTKLSVTAAASLTGGASRLLAGLRDDDDAANGPALAAVNVDLRTSLISCVQGNGVFESAHITLRPMFMGNLDPCLEVHRVLPFVDAKTEGDEPLAPGRLQISINFFLVGLPLGLFFATFELPLRILDLLSASLGTSPGAPTSRRRRRGCSSRTAFVGFFGATLTLFHSLNHQVHQVIVFCDQPRISECPQVRCGCRWCVTVQTPHNVLRCVDVLYVTLHHVHHLYSRVHRQRPQSGANVLITHIVWNLQLTPWTWMRRAWCGRVLPRHEGAWQRRVRGRGLHVARADDRKKTLSSTSQTLRKAIPFL